MHYLKLYESFSSDIKIYYHGTSGFIPFKEFNIKKGGSGIVTLSGKSYGGFFFTNEFENAEYYAEYFICKVTIKNIISNPSGAESAMKVMIKAIENKSNYLIPEIHDGAVYSDIVVVPDSNISDVNIIEWIFVGDEGNLFDKLDEIFIRMNDNSGSYDEDDEDYVDEEFIITQYSIENDFKILQIDLDYLLQIPIYKKYYDSKGA